MATSEKKTCFARRKNRNLAIASGRAWLRKGSEIEHGSHFFDGPPLFLRILNKQARNAHFNNNNGFFPSFLALRSGSLFASTQKVHRPRV